MRAASSSSGRAASSAGQHDGRLGPGEVERQHGVGVPVGPRPGDDEAAGRLTTHPRPSEFEVIGVRGHLGRHSDAEHSDRDIRRRLRGRRSRGRRRGWRARPGRRRTGSAVTVPSTVAGPTMARNVVDVGGADLDDEAADRLGEQAPWRRRRWGSASIDGAEAAGDAQLGQGDGEPALADVVARLHEPGADGGVQPAVAGRRVGIGLRGGADGPSGGAEHEVEVAAGELRAASRRAAATTLPGAVSSAVTQRPTSGTWATAVMTSVGGTAWRWPSAPVYSLFSESLPRHERRAVGDGGVVAAAHRGDQLAERRRPPRVAPREVVEQGDLVGVGADGDDVADRLVDDGVGHRLRVVEPEPRVDADADGDAVGVAGVGEHDAVAGPVAADADERAHDGAAADLVVVAVDRRRLGGDVAVAEQGEQRRRRVGDGAGARRAVGRGQRRRSSAAAAGRRGGTRCRGRARRRRRGARRGGRRR